MHSGCDDCHVMAPNRRLGSGEAIQGEVGMGMTSSFERGADGEYR